MGLFDGIKLVGDIIKAGAAAVKASEKLEELIDRSRKECAGLNPEQEKLYQECKALRDAPEAEDEKIEAAEVKYLKSLEDDASVAKAFRAEITLALEEYARANEGAIDDVLGGYMMKRAKTDEEKELVRLMLEGGKVGDKLEKLAERSQDEYKGLVKPEQAALYQECKSLAAARDKEKNTDKKNALTPGAEAAQEKYLSAIAADASFPQDFRDEIAATLAEYKRIDAEIMAKSKE